MRPLAAPVIPEPLILALVIPVAAARAIRPRAERSFIPGHRKGGTLSYEAIHRRAPACRAFYHAQVLHDWLGAVVGERLRPTADHDQSSCSILGYDQPGDHIHWHYDRNSYRGRHFTVVLSLVNRASEGGVSSGRLMQRAKAGEVIEWDTSENVLVVFEGARVFHRASPAAKGEERMTLGMTFSTDPGSIRSRSWGAASRTGPFMGRAPWSIRSAVAHLRP